MAAWIVFCLSLLLILSSKPLGAQRRSVDLSTFYQLKELFSQNGGPSWNWPSSGCVKWNFNSTANDYCDNWCGVKCDDNSGEVVSLKLPRFGLTGQLIAHLQLPSLIELDLGFNFLSGIYPYRTEFPLLQVLILSSNQFSGNLGESLFATKPHLEFVDLSLNSFEGDFPQFSASPVLSFLKINGSEVSQLHQRCRQSYSRFPVRSLLPARRPLLFQCQ